MKITIDWREGKYPTFNLMLASKEGADPFITIRDCRIVDGQKGQFVSYPAKKLESGKYWNYAVGSEAFNSAVLTAALAAKPQKAAAKDDDDIPF